MFVMFPLQHESSQVIRTKRWLYEALGDLMEEKPLSEITVIDICGQANVSRSFFYNHYKDKDELVAEVFRRIVTVTWLKMKNADERGKMNTRASYTMLYKNMLRNRLFFIQLKSCGYSHYLVDYFEKLNSFLYKMLSHTDPPEDNAYYTGYFVPYFSAAMTSLALDWISGPEPMPVEQLADVSMGLLRSEHVQIFLERYGDGAAGRRPAQKKTAGSGKSASPDSMIPLGDEAAQVVRTKYCLYTALFDCLASRPYEDVTIGQICRKAGFSRAVFYNHYHSREEFFDEIFERIIALYMQKLDRAEKEGRLTEKYRHVCFLKSLMYSRSFILLEDRIGAPHLADYLEKEFSESGRGPYSGEAAGSVRRLMAAKYHATGVYTLCIKWLGDRDAMTASDFGDLLMSICPYWNRYPLVSEQGRMQC